MNSQRPIKRLLTKGMAVESFEHSGSSAFRHNQIPLLERAIRAAELSASFRAQHGAVRILMKDGKPVSDTVGEESK